MKKLILSIAMVAFIAGTVSVSYGQEGVKPVKTEKKVMVVEPQQKSDDKLIDSIADYQSLTKTSEVRFTENEKSIADLKLNNTSMDAMKKTAKTRDIEVLEQKNITLREELVAYKKDGKTDWKAFKKEFNSDMDQLTMDLEKMKTVTTL